MNIVLIIFFFGLAMSLIVLKGIFMSRESIVRTKEGRMTRLRAARGTVPED
jgi:hypothetical protein